MGQATTLRHSSDEWLKARMRALVRDAFRCQRCGEDRLRRLEVHHIQPRVNGGSHDLSNLITLCRYCHAQEHPHLARFIEHDGPTLAEYPWREL